MPNQGVTVPGWAMESTQRPPREIRVLRLIQSWFWPVLGHRLIPRTLRGDNLSVPRVHCPRLTSLASRKSEAQSQTQAVVPLRPAIIQPGVPMKRMSGVVQQLKKERERAQGEVQCIDAALSALGSSSNGTSRTMSAAGRRKISLAQKARWAKQKARGHAPKPKRTISAAGRKRIAAAQRARWAKIKRAA